MKDNFEDVEKLLKKEKLLNKNIEELKNAQKELSNTKIADELKTIKCASCGANLLNKDGKYNTLKMGEINPLKLRKKHGRDSYDLHCIKCDKISIVAIRSYPEHVNIQVKPGNLIVNALGVGKMSPEQLMKYIKNESELIESGKRNYNLATISKTIKIVVRILAQE